MSTRGEDEDTNGTTRHIRNRWVITQQYNFYRAVVEDGIMRGSGQARPRFGPKGTKREILALQLQYLV